MNNTFETRMSAMRARLSKLYDRVEQEEEQQKERRACEHRYFVETRAGNSAATLTAAKSIDTRLAPPSSAPLSRPSTTKSPWSRIEAMRERDVNQMPSAPKNDSPFDQQVGAGSPSASVAKTREGKLGSGVNAMLQLARHHASGSLRESAARKETVVSTAGRANPSADDPTMISPRFVALNPPEGTIDSSHVPLVPGGVTGLHLYGFPERFSNPRQLTASHTANAVDVDRCNGGDKPQSLSSQESQVTDAHSSIADTTFPNEQTSFDAFRVVQERLRQKMKQLTAASRNTVVPSSRGCAPAQRPVSEATTPRTEPPSTGFTASLAVSDAEDSSPSPRPPPGTRAETATPTRSAEEHETSSRDSMALPHTLSSRQHGVDDASMNVEVLPATAEPDNHNVTKTRFVNHGSLHDSLVSDSDDMREVPREWHWMQGGMPASDTSTVNSPTDRFFDPSSRHVQLPRTPLSGTRSDSTATAQVMSSRQCRRPPERVSLERAQNGRGWTGRTTAGIQQGAPPASRRSGSRRAPSSASAPRWSGTREGSASTAAGSHKSAVRTTTRRKPISLNVEATILCPVTGAELFALLRMRGLIDSEGDTEEYRLPPVRCHRLYVTAEEHRQLKLLRHSLRSLAAEEHRKEIPSHQRVTVSARSRNDEFSPPPPVLRYMDV
ncbi:hypothetical protein, conserved [Leishmania tarentolae]|uniref:Uncharacterized protein n=1 Tax=Leishmania tarentolae TaxID=5689 RepID=A0A640KQ42_LEITA|nr:hypothetical protein, conserved [Leishmania tarentolae]